MRLFTLITLFILSSQSLVHAQIGLAGQGLEKAPILSPSIENIKMDYIVKFPRYMDNLNKSVKASDKVWQRWFKKEEKTLNLSIIYINIPPIIQKIYESYNGKQITRSGAKLQVNINPATEELEKSHIVYFIYPSLVKVLNNKALTITNDDHYDNAITAIEFYEKRGHVGLRVSQEKSEESGIIFHALFLELSGQK